MQATKTAEAFDTVQTMAEAIKNDETARVETMSPGDTIRQGDLYIVCLPLDTSTMRKIKERQLAPGDTQGSRHVLKGKCEIYEADKTSIIGSINAVCPTTVGLLVPNRDEVLIGPVFRTLDKCEVDHPEHGNKVLPCGDTFAVVYQRSLAEETRRVED